MPFSFKITSKDKKSRARTGIIQTSRGNIETPYLVPVATRAYIISLTPEDIKKLKIQSLLANTYHLHLKPGDKIIKNLGGLHKFMKFSGVIFTDSGGFQAMSLGEARYEGFSKLGLNSERANKKGKESFTKITDKGVHFKSVYDNSWHFLDAKKSMQIQSNLGSDIIMSFDECVAANKPHSYQKQALNRTHKWTLQSLKYHNKKQALYGIIQGGQFKDLRIQGTKFVSSMPFDGIAIGGSFGESFGDSKKDMAKILDWIMIELQKNPESYNKPRHMLGIGWVDDLFECVERGIDTFDCVHMTRIARHGQLYISPTSGGNLKNKFTLSLRKRIFKHDNKPIDLLCNCSTCKKYSRAYLHNLIKKKDLFYNKLATVHNIHFILNLLSEIRKSIKNGKFQQLKKEWLH